MLERTSRIRVGSIEVEFRHLSVEVAELNPIRLVVGFYTPQQSVTTEDCWEDFMGHTGLYVPEEDWGLEGEWDREASLEEGKLKMWERTERRGMVSQRSIYSFEAGGVVYRLSLQCFRGGDAIGRYEGMIAPLTRQFKVAGIDEKTARWLRDRATSAVYRAVEKMVDRVEA